MPLQEADPRVWLEMDATVGPSSIRLGFNDPRLTAYGGLIVMPHFPGRSAFARSMEERLPHPVTRPIADRPSNIVRGFLDDVLCGATNLGHLHERSGAADVALSEKSPYLGGVRVGLSLPKDSGMSPKELPR